MDGNISDRRCLSSSREEEQIAAWLAHEINNPLNSLLNFLYLLEHEATLGEQCQLYLTRAREEASRISQIARSAMNNLRASAAPKDANVPDILRSVLDFYSSRLEAGGIRVRARYCLDGQLLVYPGSLRQSFSNLLLNAADAMPLGGTMYARVSIAQEWTGEERRGLRVTFADNGCGVSTDDLPKITEPFFSTKGTGGTGIGLSEVKDTVQKHHGVLRVRTSTKRGRSGTIFSIFLPAAQGA